VYKHASERNGARVAIHAVKRVARATRSCLAPQGVRSVWLKRRIDPAQARRKHDTMEDVVSRLVRSPGLKLSHSHIAKCGEKASKGL